jgi:hypothetical protein
MKQPLVEPSAEYSSNKAITPALGLPEKTDGYLPLILLAIAAIAAITAIFLMKDRTEPLTRVSNLTAAKNPQAKLGYYRGVLKMYSYKEKVLCVAASVIALMLIFPPTKKVYDQYGDHIIQPTYSYDFIVSLQGGASIRIQVLLIQWLWVGLVAAIVYFAASGPTAATKVPATELEGAQRPQRPEQVQQPSPTHQSQASELIQALERLSQSREKGILTDAEFEQEKKRIFVD